jgi:hypothetical protein
MDLDEPVATLEREHARRLRTMRVTARRWPWNGRGAVGEQQHLVTASLDRAAAQAGVRKSVLFTFDLGAHASGWWRNSDYERCWHLSLCALTRSGPVEMPAVDRRAWPRFVFGQQLPKAWIEPPAGQFDPHRNAPASRFTTHVRLFVDQEDRPILPEGEVYTLKPYADGSSPEKVFR